MSNSTQRRTILMADDDAEDCLLVRDALLETGRPCDLRFVRDGEELFDYLRHEGEYVDGRDSPWPDLILMDLKMPRKDGRETIRDLKTDPRYRQIPVVALTTSSASDDVEFSYSSRRKLLHHQAHNLSRLGRYPRRPGQVLVRGGRIAPQGDRHGGKTN